MNGPTPNRLGASSISCRVPGLERVSSRSVTSHPAAKARRTAAPHFFGPIVLPRGGRTCNPNDTRPINHARHDAEGGPVESRGYSENGGSIHARCAIRERADRGPLRGNSSLEEFLRCCGLHDEVVCLRRASERYFLVPENGPKGRLRIHFGLCSSLDASRFDPNVFRTSEAPLLLVLTHRNALRARSIHSSNRVGNEGCQF